MNNVQMAAIESDSAVVGDALVPLEVEPISRLDLALYCGASGDHNPIHVDLDYARASGRPDVFVHGMLVMAHVGRALTTWAPQRALRDFKIRFVQVTQVGDRLQCFGTVAAKFEADGERRMRVELNVRNQEGLVRATGSAVIARP